MYANRLVGGVAVGALCLLLNAPGSAREITLSDVRIAPGQDEGRADNTPWSGSWFAFQSGKLAKGYNGTGADFVYENEDFVPQAKPVNDRSPLRKYDEFVEKRHGTNPKSAYLELKGDEARDFSHHVYGAKKEEYDRAGVSYGWWGHCNGWAAAAVLEREPIAPITAEGIRFDVGDLKGLLTESHWSVQSDFTGRRYNKPSAELKAKVERGQALLDKLGATDEPPVADYIAWYEGIYNTQIDDAVKPNLTPERFRSSLENVRDWAKESWEEAYKDIYPHVFHKILVSTIKNRGLAVVFDVSANEEVWNFPAFWYSSTITFTEDLPGGGKRYAVRTEVKYAHDGVSESIIGVNHLDRTYTYNLDCDAEGRPTGGEWTGSSIDNHVDFAWLPSHNPRGEDRGENPNLLFGKLLEILAADHAYGDPKLELAARSQTGDLLRSSQQLPPKQTTTWTNPISTQSPVTVQAKAASGSGIVRVEYYLHDVDQGSRFVTAPRDRLNKVAESAAAAGDFEKSFALTNGKHMVVVKGFNAAQRLVAVSEITVEVAGATPTPPADDRFEQNDSRAQAALVTPGTHANLRVEDDDWYKIDLTGGQSLTVKVEFRHSSGDLDMEVFRGSAQVGRSAGTADQETVTTQSVTAGTHFVRVYGYSGAKNDYSLTVTVTDPTPDPDPTPTPTPDPADDSFEPNDARADAALVTAGQHPVKVRDDDWFKVVLAQGDRVDFAVSFPHADGDIDIKTYNAAGALLGTSESTGDRESLSVTAQAAGSYFLHVYGYSGAQNDCSLEVTVTAGQAPTPDPTPQPAGDMEPNNSLSAAAAVSRQSYADLAIGARDLDWYKLDLAAGAQATFTIRFRHAAGDLDITLHKSDGTRLKIAQSSTDDESVSYTATEAETVYLKVYGYNGAEAPYTLSVR